jgi:hypothetical protein
MGLLVNVDNFARAETDRMFVSILADSGGVRACPADLDQRMR